MPFTAKKTMCWAAREARARQGDWALEARRGQGNCIMVYVTSASKNDFPKIPAGNSFPWQTDTTQISSTVASFLNRDFNYQVEGSARDLRDSVQQEH